MPNKVENLRPAATESRTSPSPAVWAEIERALRDLSFGSVEIVVHDSRVVQIERREKIRLDR